MSSQGDTHYPMIDVVNPLSPVRRIERKGRKKETLLGGWREIFLEKLSGVGLSGVIMVENATMNSVGGDAPTDSPVVLKGMSGAQLVIETEEQFEQVLSWIKSMADDPERLFECHLNLFIDPVPPGKLLNNSGDN